MAKDVLSYSMHIRIRVSQKVPNVAAVYCKNTENLERLARAFWNGGLTRSTATGMASLLDAVTSHLSTDDRPVATKLLLNHFLALVIVT